MSIRDKLYDLKREQEAVYDRLHDARQDLRTIRSLPASQAQIAEVQRAKETVDRLESEFNQIRGMISALTPPSPGRLF